MMTRPSSVVPSRPQRRRFATDDGVSLAEVIVAMFLISGTVAALAGLLIQSLSSLKSDQNYQAATQLVNVRVEETRALSAAALNAGIPAAQISSARGAGTETEITGAGSVSDPYRYGGEAVITTATTPTQSTPLNPYRTTTTLDNVTYTLTTYLTRCWQPKTAPGTCNASQGLATDAPMARVTVVATWDPPGSRTVQSTSQQTLIYPGPTTGA